MFNATGSQITDPRKCNKVQASQSRQMVTVGQQVKARSVTHPLENPKGFQTVKKAAMAVKRQIHMD